MLLSDEIGVGLAGCDTHNKLAHTDPLADRASYTLSPSPFAPGQQTVERLIERWRQRQDMIRARLRLELQGQAMCRRLSDGDKTAGSKMWFAALKQPDHPSRPLLDPLIAAMQPLLDAQKWIEKDIKAQVRQLPLWNDWGVDVRGLGEVSFGGIIGELGTLPRNYRNPSCLWKRMGLAVIGDGRQRRVTGDAALLHGYSPARRSLMWNIGGGIIKAQVRNPKGDDGKPLGDAQSIGPLGALYLDRKMVEAERVETAMHAHNRAKRYMEKRLLREMWQADRDSGMGHTAGDNQSRIARS